MRAVLTVVCGCAIALSWGVCLGQERGLFWAKGEPQQGFRGIKWGSGTAQVPGLKYVRDPWEGQPVKAYVRPDEVLRIKGVDLKSIEYRFTKDEFSGVLVDVSTPEAWSALREEIEKIDLNFFLIDVEVVPGLTTTAGKGHHMVLPNGEEAWHRELDKLSITAVYNRREKSGYLILDATEAVKRTGTPR